MKKLKRSEKIELWRIEKGRVVSKLCLVQKELVRLCVH